VPIELRNACICNKFCNFKLYFILKNYINFFTKKLKLSKGTTCTGVMINNVNNPSCLSCNTNYYLTPVAISPARNCTATAIDGYGIKTNYNASLPTFNFGEYVPCLIPNCKNLALSTLTQT
jgi:hypothetical protein